MARGDNHYALAPCPRCGIKRPVKKARRTDLCRGCFDFKFTEPEPLAGGRWVRDGLTWRWQEHWLEWAERDAVKASWRAERRAA